MSPGRYRYTPAAVISAKSNKGPVSANNAAIYIIPQLDLGTPLSNLALERYHQLWGNLQNTSWPKRDGCVTTTVISDVTLRHAR